MKGVVALEAHQDVLVQKESCTDPGAGDGQEEPWLVAKAVPDAGGVSRLGAGRHQECAHEVLQGQARR